MLALRVKILLSKDNPDHARTIVAGAVRMHPERGICHYALALVEVAGGNIIAAKESLAVAFTATPELRAVALDDDRLGEFWRTLGE